MDERSKRGLGIPLDDKPSRLSISFDAPDLWMIDQVRGEMSRSAWIAEAVLMVAVHDFKAMARAHRAANPKPRKAPKT